MSLKSARKNAGLTMKQVGDHLGISDAAVSSWETGKSLPTADKLIPLSRLYKVSIEELLKGDEQA